MEAEVAPPPLLRLVGWAPQPHSPDGLPSLDPETLFVASILQGSLPAPSDPLSPRFSLATPSAILHSTVPCLEDVSAGPSSGIAIAAGSEAVSSLAARLRDVDEDETQGDEELAARKPVLHAVESLARHRLAPLIAHALFLTPLYRQHTAQIYASGLGTFARGSVPRSLRAAVAAALQGSGVSGLGVGIDKLEEEKANRVEWERKLESAGGYRAAAQGLSTEEKRETGRRFGELKFITQISSCLEQLSALLGDADFFGGASSPSRADLRIFSLLAPLVLPAGHTDALAQSSLVQLVRRYPKLTAHSRRIHQRLWAIPPSAWPVAPPPPAWTAATAAEALGGFAGRGYARARSVLASPSALLRSRSPAEPRQRTTPAPPPAPSRPQDQQEGRQLQRGRWIWIGASIAGFIWTVFASGLISIEVVDEDEDDADSHDEDSELSEAELAAVAAEMARASQRRATRAEEDDDEDESEDDEAEEDDALTEEPDDDKEDEEGQGPWQEEYDFDLDDLEDDLEGDDDDDFDEED